MTTSLPNHPQLMRQAIELAKRGRGSVEPNPSVGCVIVKEGRVIGQGYTQPYGGAHAEPTALANCSESPVGATAYVTLEPCCHTNKQTPPCVPRLIEAKILRVIVGCLDPNPSVNGQGVAQLRDAGIEVVTGILEKECQQLIAPFIATTVHHRPYITLKWAQTVDGKIAGPNGRTLQISNEHSRLVVHALRGRCDAIAVGINTVLADNPVLTVREAPSLRPLTRYVLDRQLRIPLESSLVQSAKESPVVVATYPAHMTCSKAEQLRALGAELIAVSSLGQVIADWHRRRFTHVLVEPGSALARAFFAANYADRLWVITSPKELQSSIAPSASPIPGYFHATGKVSLQGDELVEYLNTQSPVFFSPEISADFPQK
ncbi:MAG TPA: bifunctional diaminohydroxyphosphoribosylaminopyrimidine deaminase/5-amino-6-(5-phosphoribosylamino)uracil reductase RibD [Tepidisphaeraceae bacterium]